MCGIFGAWPITENVTKMLPIIGLEMEGRGRDAWGASDGEEVIRHVGSLSDSWYLSEPKFREWKRGIFHTRGASHGSPKKLENAHPFEFVKADGTSVIGIHNGIVSNHEELDNKYGRNFEVDSMHLWKSRADGVEWDDIRGWGNLAWFETTKDEDGSVHRDLHLARFNADAVELFRLKTGELVFASTQAPVRVTARMFGAGIDCYIPLKEYTEYYIREDEHGKPKVFEVGRLPFPKPGTNYGGRVSGSSAPVGYGCAIPQRLPSSPSSSTYTPPGKVSGSASLATMGWCIRCNSIRVDQEKQLICNSCMLNFIIEWEKEQDKARREAYAL